MDEGTMRTVCAGHDGQILSFPCRLLITYTYAIIIRVYLSNLTYLPIYTTIYYIILYTRMSLRRADVFGAIVLSDHQLNIHTYYTRTLLYTLFAHTALACNILL